jgi:Na+/melibiose symporter-like transporter
MTSGDRSEKLRLRTRLMVGVGDAGINLADTMVGLLFAIFLTDVVGLRPALAGLAVFIGRTSEPAFRSAGFHSPHLRKLLFRG